MKNLIKVIALFITLSITTSTNATLFYLDEFSVFSNNINITDTFSDGLPPPSGPFGSSTYVTRGELGPESGGGARDRYN